MLMRWLLISFGILLFWYLQNYMWNQKPFWIYPNEKCVKWRGNNIQYREAHVILFSHSISVKFLPYLINFFSWKKKKIWTTHFHMRKMCSILRFHYSTS